MHAVRVVTSFLLLLFLPPIAHADGYFSFADIPIPGDRIVIGTVYDSQAGVIFTVLPYGNGTPGEMGLVRSSALSYCIDPAIDYTLLGTSEQGSGNIGAGVFEIRIDFATPVVAPAVVHVQVQTLYDWPVLVTLYDQDGNVVGTTWPGASNLVTGHCGPGDPIFPKYMNGIFGASSASSVAYATVWVAAPFTVESVSWQDHVVAVEPVTWGRVKAMYHRDRGR